jgi:hypothetical protein
VAWVNEVAWTPITGQWVHIAACRSGGTIRYFQNGSLIGSSAISSSLTLAAPAVQSPSASQMWYDDIRITKAARYTAAFTPPTALSAPIDTAAYKYISLIGGMNDSAVDYGIEKLSDSSLKVKKMTASGGGLPAIVDRVYVNIIDYSNSGVSGTSGTSGTSGSSGTSGAAGSSGTSGISGPSVSQTILTNFTTNSESTISDLSLSTNKWFVNVVEEWDAVPVDSDYANVSLLCHFDGVGGSTNFIDNSSNALSIPAYGNAQISTAESKFGGGSLYVDGVTDYLSLPTNTLFDFGTNNFTVECWVLFEALTTNRIIVDRWASGNSTSWQLYWRSTGTSIAFAVGGTIVLQDATTTRIVANQWYHIAVTRSGTTARLFIDGTQVASATDSSSLTNSLPLSVGVQFSTLTNYLNGYVDELRITKGVARYTSGFSVATVPFPNSASQSTSKYVGLIGGLNDLNVDYGVEKLSDTSIKIRKMTASGGSLPASVNRVYVNIWSI